MGELISVVTDREIEQLTRVTVAMNCLVNPQELAKTMDSGLEVHQLVKVSLLSSLQHTVDINFYVFSQFQYFALPCPTHLMEELTSVVADLVLEHFIPATVAMSLLVYLQGPVRIMDNGLERHQLVKVRYIQCYRPSMRLLYDNYYIVRCANLPTPQNGRVDQRGNNPGDIATYICNSGYELVGQSTRTCQTSGQWSGDAPTCERLGMHIY